MINFQLRNMEAQKGMFFSEMLEKKIMEWGATIVGFGDVSVGLAPEFRHIPRAIALAVKHPKDRGTYKCGSITAYSNQFEEVDRILENVQKKIVLLLKSYGWRTLALPPDTAREDGSFISRLYPLFPHKTAATCAGLGWIGKSGLLVNHNYGARLSWATVLTDAPLNVATPNVESKCGNCKKCVDACPALAIKDVHWQRGEKTEVFIDTKACANHLSYTAKVFHKHICGLCILACPQGARKTLN